MTMHTNSGSEAGYHLSVRRTRNEAKEAISNALTELQCIDLDNFDADCAKENIKYAIKALLKGKENDQQI